MTYQNLYFQYKYTTGELKVCMHSVLRYRMDNREETEYVDSERETRIKKIPIPSS